MALQVLSLPLLRVLLQGLMPVLLLRLDLYPDKVYPVVDPAPGTNTYPIVPVTDP